MTKPTAELALTSGSSESENAQDDVLQQLVQLWNVEHIYAISHNPWTHEKEETFIVADRCDNCIHKRQMCTRSQPACELCANLGIKCVTSRKDFVLLPLPKKGRGTNKRPAEDIVDDVDEPQMHKQQKRGFEEPLALALSPSGSSLRRSTRVSRPVYRGVPVVIDDSAATPPSNVSLSNQQHSFSTPATSDVSVSHGAGKAPRKGSSDLTKSSIKKKVKSKSSITTGGEVRRRIKLRRARAEKLSRRSQGEIQGSGAGQDSISPSGPRRVSKSSGRRHVKRSNTDVPKLSGRKYTKGSKESVKDEDIIWNAVPPPNIAQADPTRSACVREPHIWASSVSELYKILPELSKPVNGIVCGVTPTTLLISGSSWLVDHWRGTVIELTMVREYSCPVVGPGMSSIIHDALANSPEDTSNCVTGNDRANVNATTTSLPLLSEVDAFLTGASFSETMVGDPDMAVEWVNMYTISRQPSPEIIMADAHISLFSPPTIPVFQDSELEVRSEALVAVPFPRDHAYQPEDLHTELCQVAARTTGDMQLLYNHDGGLDSLDNYPAKPEISQPESLAHELASADVGALFEIQTDNDDIVITPTDNESDDDIPLRDIISRVRTNKIGFVPDTLPLEIQQLIQCHESTSPTNILISQDSSLLPFTLPPHCGIAFAGLFNVTKINGPDHMELATRDGRKFGRMTWRFTFDWVPSIEYESGGLELLPPWWSPETPVSQDHVPAFTLLPPHISGSKLNASLHGQDVSSEFSTILGWHCDHCGKLNMQRLLRLQKCSQCQTSNGLSAVDLDYVRNPNKAGYTPYPADVPEEDVELSYEEGNMLTCVYTIGEAIIKHIFTRNMDENQIEATRLWHDFQMNVEFSLETKKTGLSAGPYFSYLVGSGHDAEAESWDDVPDCVLHARDYMQYISQQYGREEEFILQQLVALAWTNTGTKKGHFVSANASMTVILCLGANVEFSIFAQSVEESSQKCLPPSQLDGDIEDEGNTNAGFNSLLYEENDGITDIMQDKSLISVISAKGTADNSAAATTFVTLVHGDVLIFAGDNFEYSMRRTGMSIVLLGLSFGSEGTVT